jgi:hypothetical protein
MISWAPSHRERFGSKERTMSITVAVDRWSIPEGVLGSAVFSPDGKYRYRLDRD